jgi:hypothetical protein
MRNLLRSEARLTATVRVARAIAPTPASRVQP